MIRKRKENQLTLKLLVHVPVNMGKNKMRIETSSSSY